MTKNEWQNFHQVTDDKMFIIEQILILFSIGTRPAKVVRIWDTRVMGKFGDFKNIDRKTVLDKTFQDSVIT